MSQAQSGERGGRKKAGREIKNEKGKKIKKEREKNSSSLLLIGADEFYGA